MNENTAGALFTSFVYS